MTLIKDVRFVPDEEIEGKAYRLLADFESQYGGISKPPIPIDKLIEKFLELRFDWEEIEDNGGMILGCLHPDSRKIMMNSRHIDFFDAHWGTEEYTKAHEVGHWDLHIAKTGEAVQLGLPGLVSEGKYLCRSGAGDSREYQAEKYAAYLLMPHDLIMQEIDGVDLTKWPNLYRLREAFKVSITAMTKRLTALGLISISDKVIYRSSEEARRGAKLF
jgi:hypothetical protein